MVREQQVETFLKPHEHSQRLPQRGKNQASLSKHFATSQMKNLNDRNVIFVFSLIHRIPREKRSNLQYKLKEINNYQ